MDLVIENENGIVDRKNTIMSSSSSSSRKDPFIFSRKPDCVPTALPNVIYVLCGNPHIYACYEQFVA